MKGRYYKYAEGLPPWAKGVIAVVVLGGLAFVSYKIYKKIADIPVKKDEKDVIKEVEKEIKVKIQAGEKLSKPLSTYKSTANAIFEKLDGCEQPATERDVIVLVINQVKKPIDWLQLVSDFGVRKVDNCGVFTSDTQYELGKLLKDQLDASIVGKPLVADNFTYNPGTSGQKTGYLVLQDYLKKIGVAI